MVPMTLSLVLALILPVPLFTAQAGDTKKPECFSIDDVTITEGNTVTSAVFTISVPNTGKPLRSIVATTENGTAVAPGDYTATGPTTIVFPKDVISLPFAVPVVGDTVDEPDETFRVNLSSPVGATTICKSQGIATIRDDDATPTLSITDVSLAEGNSGTTDFDFIVTLSSASGQPVTVNFATANGSASSPTDFVNQTGQLTFAPGETSKPITVLVNGDTRVEPNETFFVNLSNANNASLSDPQGQGTIVNDDAAAILSINGVTLSEGNSGQTAFVFTVSLAPASGLTVTVDFATSDVSASAGSDYVSVNGTLTFNTDVAGNEEPDSRLSVAFDWAPPVTAYPIMARLDMNGVFRDQTLLYLSVRDGPVGKRTSYSTSAPVTGHGNCAGTAKLTHRTVEEPWNVRVIDGPPCVNGGLWMNVSRKEAGNPSGGSGWVIPAPAIRYVSTPCRPNTMLVEGEWLT